MRGRERGTKCDQRLSSFVMAPSRSRRILSSTEIRSPCHCMSTHQVIHESSMSLCLRKFAVALGIAQPLTASEATAKMVIVDAVKGQVGLSSEIPRGWSGSDLSCDGEPS